MKTGIAALALLLFLSAPAGAEQISVLICYPASAVSARDSEPALKEMVQVIESIGGWTPGTVQTTFTTRFSECQKKLASLQPAFAILPLGLYLHQRAEHQLLPLVQPIIGGRTSETYQVVVRKGSFKSLEQLKGRKLGSPWLEDHEFVRRLVFAGALDPDKDLQPVLIKRSLRALRQLAAGKIDAVLLNQQQAESLGELPLGKELEVIYRSPALPQIGIAASQARTSADTRKKMTRAMLAMCGHAQGKKLCELFNIDGFKEAGPGSYDQVIKMWQQ
jgi:hypothetical protein